MSLTNRRRRLAQSSRWDIMPLLMMETIVKEALEHDFMYPLQGIDSYHVDSHRIKILR